MTQLKRFGVGQTAKVAAVVYLVLGFIGAILFMPFVWLAGSMGMSQEVGIGSISGMVLVLVLPLVYAICAWIATGIACLIYNWVAGMVGGIAVELEG